MALGREISLQEQEALLQALSELATDETLIRFLEEHQEEHQGSQRVPSPLPPFKWGWYSHGLSDYLLLPPGKDWLQSPPFFNYESLPPLPQERFNGTFEWLQSPECDQREQKWNALVEALGDLLIPNDDDSLEVMCERSVEAYLPPLIAEAQELGLILPKAFVTFMSSAQLRHRVPGYFDLPPRIYPYSKQGYLIGFLGDQQGCVSWYLYLTVQGDHCILVTFSDDLYSDDFDIDASMMICAASFEEFLYRYWIESIIWENLGGHLPQHPPGGLTLLSEEQRHDLFQTCFSEEQRRYLSHYLSLKREMLLLFPPTSIG
jgi:hypothetical protein